MKHLFIINPTAGKYDRSGEITEKIKKAASARGLDYEIAITSAPRDATAIVQRAAQEGELRVYASGGDGTLNEVVNGAVFRDNVAVTHMPIGSGNDFIKIFSDGGKSFSDLDNLFDCEETAFDVIRCNDRYSNNICSIGFDARIGTSIANYKRWPLVTGTGAYMISTVVNTIKGIHEHYVIDIDGEAFDSRYTLICVASGRYYGGSFNPVPEAEPDDGILDVLMVKDISRLTVPAIIKKYASGKFLELPEMITYRRCKKITVTCDGETPVNLDGELILAERVEMEVCPKAFRFFYPKDLTWNSEKAYAKANESNRELSATI